MNTSLLCTTIKKPTLAIVYLKDNFIKFKVRVYLLYLQVAALGSGCLGQFQGDPSLAKILQEQRFNAGGGKFGSAFAQEDGHVFREESSGNNNRYTQPNQICPRGTTTGTISQPNQICPRGTTTGTPSQTKYVLGEQQQVHTAKPNMFSGNNNRYTSQPNQIHPR